MVHDFLAKELQYPQRLRWTVLSSGRTICSEPQHYRRGNTYFFAGAARLGLRSGRRRRSDQRLPAGTWRSSRHSSASHTPSTHSSCRARPDRSACPCPVQRYVRTATRGRDPHHLLHVDLGVGDIRLLHHLVHVGDLRRAAAVEPTPCGSTIMWNIFGVLLHERFVDHLLVGDDLLFVRRGALAHAAVAQSATPMAINPICLMPISSRLNMIICVRPIRAAAASTPAGRGTGSLSSVLKQFPSMSADTAGSSPPARGR